MQFSDISKQVTVGNLIITYSQDDTYKGDMVGFHHSIIDYLFEDDDDGSDYLGGRGLEELCRVSEKNI